MFNNLIYLLTKNVFKEILNFLKHHHFGQNQQNRNDIKIIITDLYYIFNVWNETGSDRKKNLYLDNYNESM